MQYIDSLPQFLKKDLCVYLWLCWGFIAALGFCLLAVSGGHSLLWRSGLSLRWLLLLQSMGSRCSGCSSCGRGLSCGGSWALELWLSSCGTWAELLCGVCLTCYTSLHFVFCLPVCQRPADAQQTPIS